MPMSMSNTLFDGYGTMGILFMESRTTIRKLAVHRLEGSLLRVNETMAHQLSICWETFDRRDGWAYIFEVAH